MLFFFQTLEFVLYKRYEIIIKKQKPNWTYQDQRLPPMIPAIRIRHAIKTHFTYISDVSLKGIAGRHVWKENWSIA